MKAQSRHTNHELTWHITGPVLLTKDSDLFPPIHPIISNPSYHKDLFVYEKAIYHYAFMACHLLIDGNLGGKHHRLLNLSFTISYCFKKVLVLFLELLALFPKEIKLKLLINRCTHVWIDMHAYSPPSPPVAFELTNSKQVFTEQQNY